MNRSTKLFLFWTPRILCICFAFFLSLFALDVFSENYGIGETIVAFFMHLIPTFGILIVLAVAWRWEWIGAILFALLATLYLILSWGKFPWSAYAVISGSLMLLAILFLLNWRYKTELGTRTTDNP